MTQNAKININEIEQYIPKLKIYNMDNQASLNKIKRCLYNIADCYQTKYGKEILLSSKDYIRNFPTLIENQKNYINTLTSSKNKYEEIQKQNIKIFENIENFIDGGGKNN